MSRFVLQIILRTTKKSKSSYKQDRRRADSIPRVVFYESPGILVRAREPFHAALAAEVQGGHARPQRLVVVLVRFFFLFLYFYFFAVLCT